MATATSVNKPVDVKQKDADVARKLQVYGIISAFQYGKYPSVRAQPHLHVRATMTASELPLPCADILTASPLPMSRTTR